MPPLDSHGFLSSRMKRLFSDLAAVPFTYKEDLSLAMLMALPADTADYLASVLNRPEYEIDSDPTPDKMLIHMLNFSASIVDIEDVIYLCCSNEMIGEMAFGYFEWEENDQYPTANIREVITGLRKYNGIDGLLYDKSVAIRRQGEAVAAQVEALVYMADFLEVLHEYQYEAGVTMVHDPELAALVAEFPGQIGVIMGMMESEEDQSVFAMREVLSGNVHSSLSTGVI